MLQAEVIIADLLPDQVQEAVATEAVAPAPEVLEVDLAAARAHQEEVAEDSKSQKSILTH